MPNEVYVKVTGDDGVDTFVPADLTQLEIPAEVVHAHPAYKDVVKESIKRREKVAKLQEQIAALSKDEDEPEPTPTPTPEPALNFRNREELLNFILEEQEKASGAKQTAAQQRKTLIDGLITEHKLGSDAYEVLDLSADPQKTAAALGRAKYRFDDASGGEQTTEKRLDSVVAAIAQRLDLGS